MEIKCNECDKIFENVKIKANHVRWKHRKTFSDIGKIEHSKKIFKSNEKRFGKWIIEEIPCFKCGFIKEHKYREGKKKEKNFCSKSCANSRILKYDESFKKKVSDAIKKKWQDEEYIKKMFNREKFYSSR